MKLPIGKILKKVVKAIWLLLKAEGVEEWSQKPSPGGFESSVKDFKEPK